MTGITIKDLAEELNISKDKLSKYLKENIASFNSIMWTEPYRNTHISLIEKDKFFEIRNKLAKRDEVRLDNFILDTLKNLEYDNEVSKLRTKSRNLNRGRNIISSNGRSIYENTLKNGKTYVGSSKLVNPVKFAYFDGNKFKNK